MFLDIQDGYHYFKYTAIFFRSFIHTEREFAEELNECLGQGKPASTSKKCEHIPKIAVALHGKCIQNMQRAIAINSRIDRIFDATFLVEKLEEQKDTFKSVIYQL